MVRCVLADGLLSCCACKISCWGTDCLCNDEHAQSHTRAHLSADTYSPTQAHTHTLTLTQNGTKHTYIHLQMTLSRRHISTCHTRLVVARYWCHGSCRGGLTAITRTHVHVHTHTHTHLCTYVLLLSLLYN